MSLKIAVMPGDGIGIEIVAEAVKILNHYRSSGRLDVELEEAPVGGAGYDAAGKPLPDETLALARSSDAILFGAIGGPEYDGLARELRPDVCLFDIRMPELDGIEATRLLAGPGVDDPLAVVVITTLSRFPSSASPITRHSSATSSCATAGPRKT